jgi:hypothetical protein
MVLHLSPAEFLELGLDIVGFEQHRRQRTCIATKLRRFRAHFGVGPEAYSAIFTDLQTTDIDGARIDKPNPIHFFMTMNWLCTYKVEEELAGTFKVSEKTARKWIWKYTSAIQALKGAKVGSKCHQQFTTARTIRPFLTDFLFLLLDCLDPQRAKREQ